MGWSCCRAGRDVQARGRDRGGGGEKGEVWESGTVSVRNGVCARSGGIWSLGLCLCGGNGESLDLGLGLGGCLCLYLCPGRTDGDGGQTL